MIFWQIDAICQIYGKTLKTPLCELPEEALNDILNGTDQKLNIQNATLSTSYSHSNYEGLIKYIELQQSEEVGSAANKWSGQFYSQAVCPECKGQRLNKNRTQLFH